MANDDIKQQASVDQVLKNSQKIHERPLDPTRDAADILGEGRSGTTSGDPRQISAETDEVPEDTSVLPGGTIEHPTHLNPTGFTKEQLSDAEYNKNIISGMSAEKKAFAEDLATEEDNTPDEQQSTLSDGPVDNLDEDFENEKTDSVSATPFSDLNHTKKTNNIDLNDTGEEDPLGGSAPDPDKEGGDVGDWMKRATGEDPDSDMDHPEPVNEAFSEKIDSDEDKILES